MKPYPDPQFSPEEEEAIIRVAYGEAGFLTRRKVERLTHRNPEAARLLAQHQKVAATAMALRAVRCPATVCQRVGMEVESRPRPSWRIYPVLVPTTVFAAIALLAVHVSTTRPIAQPAAGTEYSEAEVMSAQRDLVVSAQFISIALQKAGQTSVRTIRQDVAQPVQRVITDTNQRLLGN